MATELWAIGLVILATILGSFGPIMLKKSARALKFSVKSVIKNKYLIGGLLFYGLGTVAFIPALRGGELSVLYPFVALVYIWVSLLSIKFLKEKMNLCKWVGVLLIIIGVTFIGIGS
jgi:uncharacterized membrane protein